MKKSINGFFLAETIIMIALVTTVVAFLYPNVSKLYENYNNRVKIYDQVQDLYTLKAIEKYLNGNIDIDISDLGDNNMKKIDNDLDIGGIQKLYISKYMSTPSPLDDEYKNDYEFNKYLKRLKKTTFSPNAYRLIGIFEDGRFASIKILLEDAEYEE